MRANGSMLPLLPRGAGVFTELPLRAVVLDALAPAIGDGIIAVEFDAGWGVLLVEQGRIANAFCGDGAERLSGDAALARIQVLEAAAVSAWHVEPSALATVPALLQGEVCYADLRLEWTDWQGLLHDLRSRDGVYIVMLDTPRGRGVTRLDHGRHTLTYTDAHTEPGDGALLDELAGCGSGVVNVVVERAVAWHPHRPQAGGATTPAAAVEEPDRAEGVRGVADRHGINPLAGSSPSSPGTEGSGDTGTFAEIFGVAEPSLPRRAATTAPAAITLAALLPELKLIVRSRLELSAPRVERLLDEAAREQRSLADAAAAVRTASVRGVMPTTLEQLADDLLSAGQRIAR